MTLPYTATEAAEILGLDYHTFMARVRRGIYTANTFGRQKAFDREYINKLAEQEKKTTTCS